jgi:hypothetical protein
MTSIELSNARVAGSPPPLWGRDRVGGIAEHQRSGVPPPLTPPHKGEGDPAGASWEDRRSAGSAVAGLLLVLGLVLGWGTDVRAAELAFDLRIEKGRVAKNMRLIRVKQGDAVTLRWTSDRPIVLHLHGYDIEKKIEPGAVTEMAFVASATGRFSVEEHKADAKGGHSHGEAALVRIDVLPR